MEEQLAKSDDVGSNHVEDGEEPRARLNADLVPVGVGDRVHQTAPGTGASGRGGRSNAASGGREEQAAEHSWGRRGRSSWRGTGSG